MSDEWNPSGFTYPVDSRLIWHTIIDDYGNDVDMLNPVIAKAWQDVAPRWRELFAETLDTNQVVQIGWNPVEGKWDIWIEDYIPPEAQDETPAANAPGKDVYCGAMLLYRSAEECAVGDVFYVVGAGDLPTGAYRVAAITDERVELERVNEDE
jgi:hypothetical protein